MLDMFGSIAMGLHALVAAAFLVASILELAANDRLRRGSAAKALMASLVWPVLVLAVYALARRPRLGEAGRPSPALLFPF